MKNKIKKVLAVFLSIVLVFGMLSIQSLAETVVTLTPDGTGGNADVIYVSMSGLSTNQKYNPVDGYVKLNGETLNNEYELDYAFTYAGWGNVHYIKLTHIDTSKSLTFEAGSVLTIGGTFKGASDGSIINITEVNLKCIDPTSAWEVYTPAIDVTLTPDGTGGNADVIYVSMSGLSTNQKYNPVGGYVKLNGEILNNEYELDYAFTYAGWGNVHYIKLTHIDTSKSLTFEAGSVLTIGGTFKGASDGTIINIAEVNLKCIDPTSAWEVYTPAIDVTLTSDGTAGNSAVVYVQFTGVSDNQKYVPVDGYVKLDGTELRYTVDTYNEIDYAILAGGWSNVHAIKLTNALGTTYAFAEGSVLEIGGTFEGEDGTIIDIAEAKLVCGSDYTWSGYVEIIELSKPVVTLTGNTINWNTVENATGYEVYVGGEKKADVATTSYDLSTLGLELGSYQVTVKAVGGENTVAATSEAVTYTIVATPVTIVPDGTAGNSSAAYVQFTGVSGNQKYVPIDGYVKLDGTELRYTVDIYNEIDYAILAGGWSNVHAIKLTNVLGTTYAFAEGSVLEIGGTFEGEDGTIIDIAEIKLVCDSNYNWSEYVEQIELAKPVLSISDNTVSWNAVDNATNYEVYVDGEKKADTTGTTYDLSALGLGLGSYQVTVKATGGENSVAATSDAVAYTIEPTNLGTLTIESAVSGTDVNKYNNFYVNTTGVVMSNSVGYYGIDENSGLFLDEDRLENGYIINYGWVPNIYFVDDMSVAPQIGSELVVKGTFRAGTDQFTVSETTFIWNGSVWSKYVPLESVYNVTLAPHNVHDTTNTVYVKATASPESNFVADKNFKPGAYNGKVVLNDIVLTEGTGYSMMTSYSPNTLYSIQLQGGRTWNVGDKLTISGQFAYNGSAEGIEVANYTMWYDGLVWTTSEVPLRTPGDLNNNGDWDVVDLIRFKKHMLNEVAGEYKAVTELNGNEQVDEDDIQALRYIILGKYHIIDGKSVSKYNASERVNIFADGPVVQNEENLLKAYFNAGFTTLLMTEDFTQAWSDDGNTTITNADGTLDIDYENAIRTALKYGDVMVRNHGNEVDYFNASLYTQLYNLGVRQFYIWDEPAAAVKTLGTVTDEGDIPSIVDMANVFANTMPSDAMFHVNLLPSYGKTGSWISGSISFEEYTQQYVNDVLPELTGYNKTLSVDNYPLLSDGTIRDTYLKDLWTIGNLAKDNDAIVNYCIQAYKETDNTELRVPETRADISFQTNTGLALGAQSFEYFEYYDYYETDTITGILTNGLYEEIQSVNKELAAWDHVFLSFDWQGVKTYNASAYTSGVTELASLQMLSSVEASAETLVGEYKYSNATDEYGYMITNFTEPSKGTTDTITLTMSANQEVLVYTNGVGRWMNADASGKLTLSLPAGSGAFVIPQI